MHIALKRISKQVVAVATAAALLLPAMPVKAADFNSAGTEVVAGTASSITIPKPSGSEGDFMLAQVVIGDFACGSGSDDDSEEECVRINAPEGWTSLNVTTDGDALSMATFYKFVGEVELSAYTFTFDILECRRVRVGFSWVNRCDYEEHETRSLGGILSFEDVDADSPIIASAEADAPGSTTQYDLKAPSVDLGDEAATVVTFFADNSNDELVLDGADESYFAIERTSSSAAHRFSNAAFGFEQDGGITDEQVIETSGRNRWAAQTVALKSVAKVTRGGGDDSRRPWAHVDMPNGGETFAAGSEQMILWGAYAQNALNTRLSLSTDSGTTYAPIATLSHNNGWHNWTVPDVNTTTARVRMELLSYGDTVLIWDESDADFTIVGTPAPEPTPTPEVLGDTSSSIPDGIVPGFLKLPSDGNPDTQADSTVYYLGENGIAHAFISQPSYLTWYESFDGVQTVTAEQLAELTQGSVIGVRPGTSWVKHVGENKVYYVAPGNVLRWIESEAVAMMLGGAEWQDNVMDLDESLFVHYTYGAPVSIDTLSTAWPQPYLGSDEAGTWLVSGDVKRAFTGDAFAANRYQNRHIHPVQTGWQNLTAGTDITGLEEALVQLVP